MKNRVKELREAKHLTQTGFSAYNGRFFQRYIRVFVLLVG